VFTTVQGRGTIFWQSARTAAQARPGIRVPRRRAAGHTADSLEILVDTRERYPYRFAGKQACTTRARSTAVAAVTARACAMTVWYSAVRSSCIA
jgi:hypothetical protein